MSTLELTELNLILYICSLFTVLILVQSQCGQSKLVKTVGHTHWHCHGNIQFTQESDCSGAAAGRAARAGGAGGEADKELTRFTDSSIFVDGNF